MIKLMIEFADDDLFSLSFRFSINTPTIQTIRLHCIVPVLSLSSKTSTTSNKFIMISSLIGAIRQRPLLFNGITGGVLCAGSDALAQQYEHSSANRQRDDDVVVAVVHDDVTDQIEQLSQSQHQEQQQQRQQRHCALDHKRVMSAGLIGIFFGGIVYPQAYRVLDTIWKGSSLTTLVKKSMFEIATVGIFVNSTSMTSRGVFQNDKHYGLVLQHVMKELPTVTRNDVLVWLPYNMIAFSMIPAIIRPTTTAMMEASWQCYISLRSHDYSSADRKDSERQRRKHNNHRCHHEGEDEEDTATLGRPC